MIGLLLPAEAGEQAREVELPDDVSGGLIALQHLVDGNIEVVRLRDHWGCVLVINEEGKSMLLPANRLATSLARNRAAIFPNDYIAGTAVMLTEDGPDLTSAPPEVREAWRSG